MAEPISITLSLPTMILSQNSRAHWHRRGRAVKSARGSAHAEALSAIGRSEAPQWTAGRVVCHFHWDWRGENRNQYPDRSNALAACKAYIDGLVDAGVYEDDGDVTTELGEWDIDQDNPRLVMECHGPQQESTNANPA